MKLFMMIGGLATAQLVIAQSSEKKLSLDSALQLAITQSTSVLKSKNAVDINGAQVMAAYGQFLPDASLIGAYTYFAGTNFLTFSTPTLVNSTRTSATYTITSSINLFNGFANKTLLKTATLNQQAAIFTLQRAVQQISLDVTQSYLQIVLDQKIMEFARKNHETSLQRENQIKALVESGRRAEFELSQQQSQTSLDKQYLVNAENKWVLDKVIILQKLRMNPTEHIIFSDTVVIETGFITEVNENELIQRGLSQRSDLKSAALVREAADLNIMRSRSGYYPRLSFSAAAFGTGARYTHLSINGLNTALNDQKSMGNQLSNQVYGALSLNLGWTFFDKYVTRSSVAQARINALNAQLDYENVNLQIASEIKQAVSNYQTAVRQVSTTVQGLTAAEKTFDVLSGRYNIGASNFIELSIAQNNLLLARQNKAQAIINLAMQKKALDYFVGE